MNIPKSRTDFSRPSPARRLGYGFLLALLASPGGALAAPAPPGAGTLGNQLRQMRAPQPAPSDAPVVLPEGQPERDRLSAGGRARVVINRVQFTGLPPGSLTEARLQQAVAGDLHHPLSFAGLEQMAARVTALYRQDGLLVARAILPAQTIREGVLHIQIVPGYAGATDLQNTSGLRDGVAGRLMSSVMPEGVVMTRSRVERGALLLSDIPGVNTRVALKAGDKNGTTSQVVTLTPGQRTGGYAGLDNQGDPTTGRSRVMVGGFANNLLGLGDQLRVDLLDAYEHSDLLNGSLDYSLLAGGAYGTRVGGSYSHLNYRYSLSGLGFRGYSDNWGLYVTQPWVRTPRARVDVRLDVGQQFLTDKYPSQLAQFTGGSTAGHKRADLGTLSVSGSVLSLPGGLTQFSVSGTSGSVSLRDDTSRFWSGAERTGSDGAFARLGYRLSHEQEIHGPFSVYAGVNGQMASHNLDASQKLLLGGPNGVRAYDVGDGAVDEGLTGTVELRARRDVAVPFLTGHTPQLTGAVFYDQGWGNQYRDNRARGGSRLSDNNALTLSGAGLSAGIGEAGSYQVSLTWAHRTGNADPNAVHDDRNRFWVSAIKTF